MKRKERTDTVKQQITKILKLKREGVTNENIARRFDVSRDFIRDLVRREYDKTANYNSSAGM